MVTVSIRLAELKLGQCESTAADLKQCVCHSLSHDWVTAQSSLTALWVHRHARLCLSPHTSPIIHSTGPVENNTPWVAHVTKHSLFLWRESSSYVDHAQCYLQTYVEMNSHQRLEILPLQTNPLCQGPSSFFRCIVRHCGCYSSFHVWKSKHILWKFIPKGCVFSVGAGMIDSSALLPLVSFGLSCCHGDGLFWALYTWDSLSIETEGIRECWPAIHTHTMRFYSCMKKCELCA